MIKLLICDDHPLVRDGIKMILSDQEDIVVIGESENGERAIEYIIGNDIDILLLDINMPKLNGLETIKRIKKDHKEVKVIVLSMLDDLHIIKSFIEYGAKGYLIKNAGKDEIIQTIRKVAKNENAFEAELLMQVLDLKKNRKKTTEKSLFPKLSRREKEILSLILEELTTAEIAEKLFISFGTVETHRRNMMNKLGVKNTAGLVRVSMEFNMLENGK